MRLFFRQEYYIRPAQRSKFCTTIPDNIISTTMVVEQLQWTLPDGWRTVRPADVSTSSPLVLVFGGTDQLSDSNRFNELRARYPEGSIISCSTSGEILDTSVYDDTIVSTAISFESTSYKVVQLSVDDYPDSFQAGKALIADLPQEGLAHVFVLADGQKVNGSELVKGLSADLSKNVAITGGLAGDGKRFARTLVGADAPPVEGTVVVVGFYGERLKVGYGSVGGWDSFGPDRVITRSEGNVLHELDGRSALELYKTYLGPLASELPGSALLFPLSIRATEDASPVVRTILSVDDTAETMTFAGDLPEGSYARLMKANFDRLIDGASMAASDCCEVLGAEEPEVAILVSCVGRKLVLAQRTEEEVEGVRDVLGGGAVLTGFYSYGEISPVSPLVACELHNQTMTITTFSER